MATVETDTKAIDETKTEDASPKSTVQTTVPHDAKASRQSSKEDWPVPVLVRKNDQPKIAKRNPVLVERTNLLNMSKLCIKGLIESALEEGRTLDSDHQPLQQFFALMEHVMGHGLKGKKSFLDKKKEFWAPLESLERIMPEASEIIDSVKNLPGIKTNLGRGRAWLRLALMQKKLADYFKALIENKDILSDYYDGTALMMEEESMVISGLLVGLNVIDCNLFIKEEDLDNYIPVIDFSTYLKDGNYLEKPDGISGDTATGQSNMTALLDQKNYVEELNRHLNATVTNLQARVRDFEVANSSMKEELAVANNNVISLQAINEKLTKENEILQQNLQKKLEIAKADIDVERETYQTSRQGLNELYDETRKSLEQETTIRLDVEKELELQISMKQEMEMAMRLLEKDIHEKQDTVVSLRKQLEDIKSINIDLYNKMQQFDGSLKHKTELVGKLEEKTKQMAHIMKEIESKLKQSEKERIAAEETARKLGQLLAEKESKRIAVETDLKIESEWRTTLQTDLSRERENLTQLQMELQQMSALKKEYADLEREHQQLKVTCEEQEQSLAEIGSHLSTSKLQMEDLKEMNLQMKEKVWTDDKSASSCKQCEKPFSVARRKHHCRHCGDIYCNNCSDNTMPLPSSAKPVRVCDTCHTHLLQRFSASS
ncbi:RUN and FYVE domain-containing protein 2-like [Saccoglossus kowalevskii]|uniref:RUN and FYVE domain-containing protein 2-like n=1 Tax=Saccoglossus kowalevskii TaxID=10224 RepID=A0ABM0M757_SACKO|nr:PREDICTED: RUN and FYVE domain-containing protein 2-like [Saccoglossus kowalevskii]